ncbi:MAG: DUF6069 family protein [Angustibacter sp.]
MSTPPTSPPATRGGLLRDGAIAGAIAAVATVVIALIGRAADVDLRVRGQEIPAAAFAVWTVVGAAIGVVLALLLKQRRRFVAVTVAATLLSLIPPVAAEVDGATSAVLVLAHLVAAAVIIPALARRLPG